LAERSSSSKTSDPAGVFELGVRRCEDLVAGIDLGRVDQGLAVETEIAGLRASAARAVRPLGAGLKTHDTRPVSYSA
jgi:hypothetical protein